MATNEHEPNISAWDAMMSSVAGLPEIERLRAENAAMRPFVEWMAQAFVIYGPGRPGDTQIYRHIPVALIEQARSFVAQHPAQGAE